MKIFGVRLAGLGGTIKNELDNSTLDCILPIPNDACVKVRYKDGTEELYNFVEFRNDW